MLQKTMNTNMKKIIVYIFGQMKISSRLSGKLQHNFHELTWMEMLVYFFFLRYSLKKDERFFFEGSRRILGQMYIADRKGLHDAIIKYRPQSCFEVGTYTGGGSTYFLASAFYKLGRGKVYTLENDKRLHKKAVLAYKRHAPHLLPFVEFIYGDSVESFKPYLDESGKVDSVFLDGAEDGKQTMEQYMDFYPYFKTGTILMAHDWNTDKTSELKPYILKNDEWTLTQEIKPPESVGFVVFKKN